MDIHVSQEKRMHWQSKIRGVVIPVEQIKRGRRFTLQVIIDDVIPDEIVGPQGGKATSNSLPADHPALFKLSLALSDEIPIDIHLDITRLAVIDHHGHQG